MVYRTGRLLSGIALAAMVGIATVSTQASAATLHMAWSQDATGLDPHKQTAFSSLRLLELVYEPLVRLDAQLQIVPAIADSWQFSKDAKELTFKLNPKAKFQNGAAVTAADVKASFERILDEKTGAAARANFLSIASIDTPDTTTVVFHLSQPDVPILTAMSDVNAAIVPASEIAAGSIGIKAVGSGPFKIASFAPGESWELVRNPNYWRAGLPYLDGIRQVKIDEPATLVQSLLSGQSDVIGQVGPAQVRQVDGSPGAHIVSSPNSGFMYVVMDMTQAPFDDPKVIKAVKAAVDRQALLNIVFQGHGTLTSDVNVWPGHPSYPPGLGVRAQNIEEAKRLLAEAGHPNGIDLQLYTSPSLSGMVEMATAFAEIVRPAGIRVAIQQENSGTYWSQVWQTKPMYISYSGARPPVATIGNLYVTKPAYAETKISNPEIDKLLAEVCASLDENKQNELLQQAWSIVADQAGASISFALNQLWGMRKTVQGVKPHSEDNLQFHEAHIA